MKDEVISSVLEYTKNKILVHVTSRDIYVVHEWQVVHRIKETSAGNTMKFWIAPLPGFDEEKFPFVICNGWETYNLINTKEFSMQTLVNATGMNCRSQVGAFFVKEEYGFNMHFATQTLTDRNTKLENWHCMAFREDFH